MPAVTRKTADLMNMILAKIVENFVSLSLIL